MQFDSLLKLIPESPWVTVLLIIVILYMLIERVFNFTTSIFDRRSDVQLLNQTDKAASILEKLPDNHQAKVELLEYIAAGPIAELSRRQAEKLKRQENLTKRRERRSRVIVSFITSIIIFILLSGPVIEDIVNSWQQQDMEYTDRVLLLFMAVLYLSLVFFITFLTIYGLNFLSDKLVELLVRQIERAKTKIVLRRKNRGKANEQ